MRPQALEVEGLTCFRERQRVDFARLDLFAIAGPTGSGKSSLLDAMVLALYGRVPRMGAHNLGELVSHGSDATSVLFTFSVGAATYRVGRRLPVAGPSRAELEILRDGDWVAIADGPRDVSRRIEGILGLDADAFLRSVLLPQGEFSAFLKADPSQRQRILIQLLRLGIYEEMRKRAAREVVELSARADLLHGRLQDLADATPEAIAERQEALKTHKAALRRVERARQAQADALVQVEAVAARAAELARQREALAAVEREADEIADAEGRLERSRRARGVVGQVDAAVRAEADLQPLRSRAEEARRATSEAEAAYERASKALAEGRRAAEQVPVLQRRAAAIGEVAALAGPRDQARADREAAQAEVARLDESLGALQRQQEEAEARARGHQAAIEASDRDLEAVGFDAERLGRLEAARDDATALRTHRAALAGEEDAVARLKGQVAAVRAELAEAQRRLEAGVEKAEGSRQALATAEAHARALEIAHRAESLRAALAVGEPCPVCAATVHEVPDTPAPSGLEEAERRLAGARDEARAAEAAVLAARVEVSGLQAREEGLAGQLGAREAARAGLRERVEAGEAALAGLVEGEGPDGEPIEEQVLAAREAEVARQRRAQALDKASSAARDALSREQAALSVLEARAQGAGEARRRAAAALEVASDRLAQLDAQIRAVVPSGDPATAAAEVARELASLEEALAAASLAEREAADRCGRLIAELRAAEEAEGEAARAAGEARARAERGKEQAGFSDDDDVRAAVLTDEQEKRTARRVQQWRVRLGTLRSRVGELAGEVGLAPVTDEHVEAARKRLAALTREVGAHQRATGQLQTEIATLEQREQQAREVAAQRDGVLRQQAVAEQLAVDLKTSNFQAHLLTEALADLVEGASVRMRELTGRYTLEVGDDGRRFYVIDHDNAGQRRRADTLSGGETFLASLSLALQLSEQVQQAAGAVRLDSMFVDEGFGTLDPETLDTVASAIETLGSAERMIGVVTHVAALTERLPARILVQKGPTGSRIAIDRS